MAVVHIRKGCAGNHFDRRVSVVSGEGSLKEDGDALRFVSAKDVASNLAVSCRSEFYL
jgi:hypothetical protein